MGSGFRQVCGGVYEGNLWKVWKEEASTEYCEKLWFCGKESCLNVLQLGSRTVFLQEIANNLQPLPTQCHAVSTCAKIDWTARRKKKGLQHFWAPLTTDYPSLGLGQTVWTGGSISIRQLWCHEWSQSRGWSAYKDLRSDLPVPEPLCTKRSPMKPCSTRKSKMKLRSARVWKIWRSLLWRNSIHWKLVMKRMIQVIKGACHS